MYKTALYLFLTASALSALVYFNHNFDPDYDSMMASVIKVEVQDEDSKELGHGSGVVLDNGYIISVNHVFADGKKYQATMLNGKKFDLEVIKLVPDKDIAILKAPASAELGTVGRHLMCNSHATLGQRVISMGNPTFLEFITTYGKVAGLRRVGVKDAPDNAGNLKTLDFLVTDLVVAPGMSGGPLFDLEGNVLGLNDAILTGPVGHDKEGNTFTSYTGISMIVSAEAVCDALNDVANPPITTVKDEAKPVTTKTAFSEFIRKHF